MADHENTTGFKIGDRVTVWVIAISTGPDGDWWHGTIDSMRWDIDVDNFTFGVELDKGGGCRADVGRRLKHMSVVDMLGSIDG